MSRIVVSCVTLVSLWAQPVVAEKCTWIPSIEKSPLYQRTTPTATKYTVYQPAEKERVIQDVLQATANGSFVSRALRMVTVAGTGKNFEMITGQDGLTFGVGDFATSDSIFAWMHEVNQRHPEKVKAAFGEKIELAVSRRWIADNNAASLTRARKNDNGLVAIPWFRQGLGALLCDPEIRGAQLAVWKATKVDPSKLVFNEHKFDLELTLGSMIGVANSMGVGGMKTLFKKAAARAKSSDGKDRELEITRDALTVYAASDPHRKPADGESVKRILSGDKVSCDLLGHRAKRVCTIATYFDVVNAKPFLELGSFVTQ